MNKTHDGKNYGISQYAKPKCFELAGKKLCFKDAFGTDYKFDFLDKTSLEYTATGATELSQYEAVKLTPDIYLIVFGLRFNALVVDAAENLAAVTDSVGEYIFLRGENSDAEFYDYTEEMTDTYVRWVFGCDRFMINQYLGDRRCACTWSRRTDRERIIKSTHVRIKDGIYLVELNGTSPFYTDFPQGASRMVFLQNYDQMTFVGCLNSPVTNEHTMVAGYGLAPETDNI